MELLFGLFPVTVVAITLAVGFAVLVTRRRHTAVRAATVGIAIAAVAMLAFALAIPHPRYDPADVMDFESRARCGPGGIPVGWPAWLPS
jgi:EamA domain-containing membrane protein RarD